MKLTIAAILALGLSAFAQEGAKQDMKNAGHETKEAAKDLGSGTVKVTKKTGRAIKHGTKRAVHATASGVDKGATKVKAKTQ